MAVILRRPQFIEDLYDIWRFIARDSEARGDDFILELEMRYEILANNPLLGVQRFRRYPRLRMFPYRSYIIIYDPIPDGSGIELIRILNAARDYHRYFDE